MIKTTILNSSASTSEVIETPILGTGRCKVIYSAKNNEYSCEQCQIKGELSSIVQGQLCPYIPPKKLTVATKYDSGKTDWSLMPFDAVEQINKVLEFGANKYSKDNWKENGGFKYSRILNSTLRHVFAYMRGETNDPESGLSHLAHAGCNIIFLLYFETHKDKYSTNDDR